MGRKEFHLLSDGADVGEGKRLVVLLLEEVEEVEREVLKDHAVHPPASKSTIKTYYVVLGGRG